MRALMIGLGAALVAEFQWVLVLFGLFLIVTGVKMLFSDDEHAPIQENRMYQWLRGHLRLTPDLHGKQFLVRGEAHGLARGWWATPLLLALIMVESADLVFAVDSIPAIFAITQDPFLVYTSISSRFWACARCTSRWRRWCIASITSSMPCRWCWC